MFELCWATHPDMPNEDGRARSRKLHYQDRRNEKKTICGMRYVESVIGASTRDICRNCINIVEQKQEPSK